MDILKIYKLHNVHNKKYLNMAKNTGLTLQ